MLEADVSAEFAEDDALAARLAGDLDAAFESLVVAYQDRLFAFVLGMSRDGGLAEEVVQDAFVKAYRALRRYSKERVTALRLAPWLHRIALNTFRNAVRGPSLPVVLQDTPPGAADPEIGPEGIALRRVDQARLLAALRRIPPRFRAAILLYHGQDLSYADAARVLGIPVGTVKSHVHRGMPLLRRALLEEVGWS